MLRASGEIHERNILLNRCHIGGRSTLFLTTDLATICTADRIAKKDMMYNSYLKDAAATFVMELKGFF